MRKGKIAFLLVLISVLTKPINFIKEVIIAATFGADEYRDAFLIAWQVPSIIGGFIFEGLPQIFVPWLIELRKKDSYNEILNSVVNLFILIFFVISLLLIFTSSFWISVIAPFASAKTKKFAMILLKIMAFSILFIGLNNVLTGIIYSYQKYVIPSLAVPLMNLIVIFFVMFGSKWYGIYSLAWGVLIGSFCAMLLQTLQLKNEKYKILIMFDKELKKLFISNVNFFLGTVIFGFSAIVEKIFASKLPTGSISCLDYAYHIYQTIFTIFLPITTVIFPKLCILATQENEKNFCEVIDKGIRMIMFFILPIVAILISLKLPIVKFVYQRGVFNEQMAEVTSGIFGIYALGLIPHSLNYLLIHIFYARKEMNMRVKYSFIFLSVYTVLNLIFIDKLKIYGIVWSNIISASICTIFFVFNLIKRINLEISEILNSLFKLMIGSVIMWLIMSKLWTCLGVNLILGFLVSLVVGVIIFFVFIYLFKIIEIKYVKDLLPEIIKIWKR
ncbi:MAG: murein biosynthesis integral membrane protein MurJ [Elusimicrobiota bacterium]|nr:murein biosynthesis integral membrane protein MurJ [Endomicrobiia bacterium]MDW8166335.1 murein biosynthesis integral membrane protein MurJ [Elusimicrobiota bacterium]